MALYDLSEAKINVVRSAELGGVMCDAALPFVREVMQSDQATQLSADSQADIRRSMNEVLSETNDP